MIAREASAAAGPPGGALDHPAPGLDGEATGVGRAADEFNADRRRGRDPRPRVGPIRVAQSEERPRAARGSQQGDAAVAVVGRCGMTALTPNSRDGTPQDRQTTRSFRAALRSSAC